VRDGRESKVTAEALRKTSGVLRPSECVVGHSETGWWTKSGFIGKVPSPTSHPTYQGLARLLPARANFESGAKWDAAGATGTIATTGMPPTTAEIASIPRTGTDPQLRPTKLTGPERPAGPGGSILAAALGGAGGQVVGLVSDAAHGVVAFDAGDVDLLGDSRARPHGPSPARFSENRAASRAARRLRATWVAR
jgi:hypothetical protein